ncbi:MAG: thiol:disulfide interchange protein DsbA/DsbL [Gammaproteobacteria bacterium]|jgi:thiol:disulfide interchange protein DsbA
MIARALRSASALVAVVALAFAAPQAAAQAAAKPAAAPAANPLAKWQSGRHYRVLSPAVPTGAAPGKVEVVEVFWYGCGACYILDPQLESWKRTKPAAAEFTRVPVTWNDSAKRHAKLFYTLQSLKQLDRLHTKVFDSIHRGGNALVGRDDASSLAAQRDWAKANGVDATAFTNTWNSMAVDVKVRQADDLVRRYRAEGTPYMVVNGRYATDVSMAGGVPQMLELINALIAAETRR